MGIKTLIKTSEIKTVFGTEIGTTRGKIKVGKLYQIGFGEVHLQVFKGKLEGIASYGVLQDGSINLTNPIGMDYSRILVWNEEKNEAEDLYL
jgi:hypothetical protein